MLQLPLLYSGNSFLLDPLHDMQTRYIHVGAATYSYWTRSRQTLTEPAMLVQPPYSHSTRSPIPLLGDPQPATHWCSHQTLTRPATRRCSRHTLLDPLHSCPSMLHDVQPPNSYWARSRQTQLNPTLHAGADAISHSTRYTQVQPPHSGLFSSTVTFVRV